jgi:outer membrane immunogenic protein
LAAATGCKKKVIVAKKQRCHFYSWDRLIQLGFATERLFMKTLGPVSALITTFILVNGANAADMPAKAAPQPPLATATPWTGFYVNGGIGYGMWAADTTVSTIVGTCASCVTQVQGGKGWLGVIGAGYDYQFTSRIVAGIFGDFEIADLEGTIQDGGPFRAGRIKEKSAWAAGVRAGWLVTPRTLSYINGGYTRARFSSTDMVTTITGASIGVSTPATNFNGWFLGGGLETSLTPNLFWRTEYRYASYNNKALPEINTAGIIFDFINFEPRVQTVTTQLVYKFNGGLPAPVYPPIAEVPTNWTGPYINAGVGYGLWTADESSINPVTGVCTICVTQRQGGKGWLGRIGAGYDWQFAPTWVVGVFGDFDWSSAKGTLQDHALFQAQAISGDIKQRSAWALGPRFGWVISPGTLAYANGGFASTQFSDTTMFNISPVTPTGTSTQSFTTNGWFVGGGVEIAFNLFGLLPKGFFMRSEYRYASYENKTLSDTGSITEASVNFKPVVQTITTSVIFKLN